MWDNTYMMTKTETATTNNYFVGPDAKGAWAHFETADQVRDWIAANAEWERTIGDETLAAANFRGHRVRVYKRTTLFDGSGENMHGAWVPDHTIRTTRRRVVPEPSPTPAVSFVVACPDGQTIEYQSATGEAAGIPKANNKYHAVKLAAKQVAKDGIYSIGETKWRANNLDVTIERS